MTKMMTALLLSASLFWVGPAVAEETPAELAAKGREAGKRYPGLANICDLSQPLRVAGQRPAGAGQRPQGQRERPAAAKIAPAKVFDNLYFLGTRSVTSWAVTTSEGIILIDALNNDAEAKEYIEGGLRELGLDPKDIKYLIITHGHGDHYGGHNYIVENYRPKVVMSDADWRELEKPELEFSNPRWGAPPKRDVSAKDGDHVTLGDTQIQLYVTPGHTPGTLSLIFPVKDGAVTHHAALWGGTGLNFGPVEERLRSYAASAQRFGDLARKGSVDVFLSNHPNRDGALEMVAALQQRTAGAPHPFVTGAEALGAFELLHHCALAQAQQVAAKQQ